MSEKSSSTNWATAPSKAEAIPVPLPSEQERRAQLLETCVRAAQGTVSAYSSLDLTRDQKAELKLNAENAQRKTLANMGPEGGFQDFGEVETKRYPGVFEQAYGADTEEVYFPLPTEGQSRETTIYRLQNSTYRDGAGRPGNSLQVGFELPTELSNELYFELFKDSQLIRDLVEALLKSLGIPESVWRKIKPHYEAFGAYTQQKGQRPPHLDLITEMTDDSRSKEEIDF